MSFRNLKVLELAELVDREVTEILELSKRRFLHRSQLLRSVHAVPSNIREAFEKETLADRNNRLVVAKGEAEETIGHLLANADAGRLPRRQFWNFRDRLALIGTMLDALIAES